MTKVTGLRTPKFMKKKEKVALTSVSINRLDWKVNLGHNTYFNCDFPFEVCKRLLELYENSDGEGFKELKEEYSEIFDNDNGYFDDFEEIFYVHMVGKETEEYTADGNEVTRDEYYELVGGGLNHECADIYITDLNSDEDIALELYGG